MSLNKYQSNAIKQIFGGKYLNSSVVNNSEVEKYYKYNSKYLNSLYSPDQLRIYSSYHGFSKYPLTGKRTEELSTNLVSRIAIPQEIIDNHLSYFKPLNEKDIDWENAYLRYSGNYQTCDPSKPIEYKKYEMVEVNGKFELRTTDETTGNKYIFTRGLPSYITSSYDLYNIIDYLLIRLQALKEMYNVVKNQYITISNYKNQNQN